MIEVRNISAEPRPGHEFQYWLAWKHRHIASQWSLRLMRRSWNPFLWKKIRQADRMWGHAVDRVHRHGQDVVTKYDVVR